IILLLSRSKRSRMSRRYFWQGILRWLIRRMSHGPLGGRCSQDFSIRMWLSPIMQNRVLRWDPFCTKIVWKKSCLLLNQEITYSLSLDIMTKKKKAKMRVLLRTTVKDYDFLYKHFGKKADFRSLSLLQSAAVSMKKASCGIPWATIRKPRRP